MLKALTKYVKVHKLNCATRTNEKWDCDCEFDNALKELDVVQSIVRLGYDMRTAQKNYWSVRSPENLQYAKKLERDFDAKIAQLRALSGNEVVIPAQKGLF